VVRKALEVDEELRPDIVERDLQCAGNLLLIRFQSKDIKSLRTSVCSFYDFLLVAVRAVVEFGFDED